MLSIKEDFDKKPLGKIAENGELDLYKVSFHLTEIQGLKWTFYEFVDYMGAKKEWVNANYEKLTRKVAWFDNIIAFHQVWNRIPHAKVGSILCDGEKFKLFKDYEGQTYQVTVLMLFKYPILPQYEDKRNKAELRLDLGHIKDAESIQLVWENLVLDMVTGNCPGITDNENEGVSGIRLNQKARDNKINGYRVEIWLLSNDE